MRFQSRILWGLCSCILLTSAMFRGGQVNAAEIGPAHQFWKNLCDFQLVGEIVEGDLSRWKRAGVNGTICLNSNGGSLAEALKIAKSGHWTGTVVPDGATCASACSIIFLSGRTFGTSNFSISRVLYPGGILGFHSPFLNIDDTRTYRSADLQEVYNLSKETFLHLFELTLSREQGGSRNKISPELLFNMLNTSPDKLYVIKYIYDIINNDIDIPDIDSDPKYNVKQILKNICVNYISSKWKNWVLYDERRVDYKNFMSAIENTTDSDDFKILYPANEFDIHSQSEQYAILQDFFHPAYGSAGSSYMTCIIKTHASDERIINNNFQIKVLNSTFVYLSNDNGKLNDFLNDIYDWVQIKPYYIFRYDTKIRDLKVKENQW